MPFFSFFFFFVFAVFGVLLYLLYLFVCFGNVYYAASGFIEADFIRLPATNGSTVVYVVFGK